METFKNTKKNFWRFFVPAVLLLVWLIPATGIGASNQINLIGTFVPAEQQQNANVYKLTYGDHTRYLGVTQANMSPAGDTGSYFNGYGWTLLHQAAFKNLNLTGNSKAIESLNAKKTCEPVKISGFLNGRQLVVTSVTPLSMHGDINLAEAWCQR